MADEQDQEFDPSGEEGLSTTEQDSLEYLDSQSGDTDVDVDEAVLQSDDSSSIANMSAAPMAAPPLPPPPPLPKPVITSLKCVHCERIRANERIFVCKSGHLICAKCIQFPTRASFRLKPRCPHCDEDAEQHVDAEKQIEELKVKCQFCGADFKNLHLRDHETDTCDQRPVGCKYEIGGCNWRGIAAEQSAHEDECVVQHKSGEEIMQLLEASTSAEPEETMFGMQDLVKLLSQTYCDLVNIRLVRKVIPTGEKADCEFYYESTVFSAANLLWYVKARIVERRPGEPTAVEYALKSTSSMLAGTEYLVFYAALGGPMELKPKLLEHIYRACSTESNFQRLFDFEAEYKNFEAPITFRLMLSSK